MHPFDAKKAIFETHFPQYDMEALLMLNVKTGWRLGKFLLGAFLVAGLAGPAFAGNVYTWVTEDGTYAFTDDSKRIPAKHKANAKRRSMGKLTRYERYTEVSSESGKPYAERLRERQYELSGMNAAAPQGAVVGAIASRGRGVGYTIPVSGGEDGNPSLWVPVTGSASVPCMASPLLNLTAPSSTPHRKSRE